MCWVLGAGCWMLGAGHFLDADCLGQGIRVGSWLADLFSHCCTYNHVPPNFFNTSHIVLLLASGSLLYSTPPFLPATPPLSPCFLGPRLLVPGLLPGALPLEHATCCPFCTTHHLTTLASHHIPRASRGRTSPTGLGSRANITEGRLLAADAPEHRPAFHCPLRQFLKFGFPTANRGTATRGERR